MAKLKKRKGARRHAAVKKAGKRAAVVYSGGGANMNHIADSARMSHEIMQANAQRSHEMNMMRAKTELADAAETRRHHRTKEMTELRHRLDTDKSERQYRRQTETADRTHERAERKLKHKEEVEGSRSLGGALGSMAAPFIAPLVGAAIAGPAGAAAGTALAAAAPKIGEKLGEAYGKLKSAFTSDEPHAPSGGRTPGNSSTPNEARINSAEAGEEEDRKRRRAQYNANQA